MTTARDVAGYIRHTFGLQSYQSVNLQKLVYFAQAWHLGWTGRPIFTEKFEAWPNGPVARSVYVDNRYHTLPDGSALDEETRMIIDAVVAYYKPFSMQKLVALTHVDAPWIEARKGLAPTDYSENELSEKTMLDFYAAKTLAGESAPQRPACVHHAQADEVSRVGAQVIGRWREGLELLAHK